MIPVKSKLDIPKATSPIASDISVGQVACFFPTPSGTDVNSCIGSNLSANVNTGGGNDPWMESAPIGAKVCRGMGFQVTRGDTGYKAGFRCAFRFKPGALGFKFVGLRSVTDGLFSTPSSNTSFPERTSTSYMGQSIGLTGMTPSPDYEMFNMGYNGSSIPSTPTGMGAAFRCADFSVVGFEANIIELELYCVGNGAEIKGVARAFNPSTHVLVEEQNLLFPNQPYTTHAMFPVVLGDMELYGIYAQSFI